MKNKFVLIILLTIICGYVFSPTNANAATIPFKEIAFINSGGTATLGVCNNLDWCSPDFPSTAQVGSIRVKVDNMQLMKDNDYQLNITLNMWTNTPSRSINDAILWDSSFGHTMHPQITYNQLQNQTYDSFGESYKQNRGIVLKFKPTYNDSGFILSLYFNNQTNFSRLEFTEFKLTNLGDGSVQAINNMQNAIISNNNQNTQTIINNNNSNTDKINKTLTDDDTSEAQSSATNFFNNFQQDSHGLSGIVTAPLSFLQSLLNSSCSPLEFPLPFVNKNVSISCMRPIYETHFPTFLTLYQLITTGLISYKVSINLLKKVRDIQNPDNDKIEVLDL